MISVSCIKIKRRQNKNYEKNTKLPMAETMPVVVLGGGVVF